MFSKRTDWALTPNRFTEAQRKLQAGGTEILDLTISNPTRAGISYDVEAILDSLRNPNALDYNPQPKGLPSARRAVAHYYSEDHHAVVDPESIALTTSTSEGYSYVLRLLCSPGDEILVPKPSYPLFEFLADLHDVKLVPYSLIYDHGWQIDFHSLAEAVNERTRAAVVVHPNNPTGSFVSRSERAELNRFCRDHDLSLIVDEVFLDYAHDRIRRETFASNLEVLTFTLSGLSKISALPQMKLAWIVTSGPSQKVTAALNRLEIIADTFLSVNAPIQLAAPVMLEQRKSIQPQLLERVRANLQELDRQLGDQKSCARLNVDGGWYAALRVPATGSDEDLAIELLQRASILAHPGHFYDFASDGYLVLSLITPPPDFCEGLRRMVALGE
jgi:alanine-synthesizing transaminase